MNCSRSIIPFQVLCGVVVILVGPGCAKSAHQTGQDLLETLIPSDVMAQVDQSVTFSDLRSSPSTYIGRTVMFSGLALKSQRVKDRTEIEVLQLPTETNMTPADRKSKSEGRFLAVQSEGFLDPAVIEKGTPLTVVGQVTGATTKPLDEGEYVYPVLDIRHLVDWDDVRSRDRNGAYGGGYGGYYGRYGSDYGPWSSWYYGFGSPFYGPYGWYPYSYYGPYYAFPRGYSVPAHPAPPPSSVPPQFRKNQ